MRVSKSSLQSMLIFVAFLFAFAAVFLLSRFIVRLAGVEVYAEYALYLTFGFAIRIVWFGILGPVFARFYSVARAGGAETTLIKDFGIGLATPFLVLLFLCGGFALFFGQIEIGDITLTSAGFLAGCMIGANIAAAGAVVELGNVMGRRWQAISAMIYPALVQLLAICVLNQWAIVDAENMALLSAAVCSIILLLQFYSLKATSSRNSAVGPKYVPIQKGMLKHSSTMLLWVPPSLLMRSTDKWYSATLLSSKDFAAFAIIMLLTQGAMSAGTSLLSRVALPTIYDLAEDASDPKGREKAHKLTNQFGYLIVLAGGVMTGLYLLVGDYVLTMVANVQLAEYKTELVVFSIGATLQSFALFQITHGHIAKSITPFTHYRYSEGAAYFVTLFVLLPRIGLIGASYAFIFSGIVAVALSVMSGEKVQKM